MSSFTISRVFEAPRQLVFDCWVQPAHFEQWFAPAGCGSRLCSADVRPGGHYHQEVVWPDGTSFHTMHAFKEIHPIDLILFVSSFCDESGQIVKHPFDDRWPDRLLTRVTFAEEGRNTRVTVQWDPVDATEAELKNFVDSQPNCVLGWTGTFDRLAATLESLTAGSTPAAD